MDRQQIESELTEIARIMNHLEAKKTESEEMLRNMENELKSRNSLAESLQSELQAVVLEDQEGIPVAAAGQVAEERQWEQLLGEFARPGSAGLILF